jgi:hypothetical protein
VDVNKDSVAMMIKLSDTWEEADKVLEEFAGIKNPSEKLGYIKGLFDVSIVGGTGSDAEKGKYDYIAMLSAVVNKKWR